MNHRPAHVPYDQLRPGMILWAEPDELLDAVIDEDEGVGRLSGQCVVVEVGKRMWTTWIDGHTRNDDQRIYATRVGKESMHLFTTRRASVEARIWDDKKYNDEMLANAANALRLLEEAGE